jgi:hypothetical protein
MPLSAQVEPRRVDEGIDVRDDATNLRTRAPATSAPAPMRAANCGATGAVIPMATAIGRARRYWEWLNERVVSSP